MQEQISHCTTVFVFFSMKPDQGWIGWLVALLLAQPTFSRIQRNQQVRRGLIVILPKSTIWSSNPVLSLIHAGVCLPHAGSSYRLTNMIPSAPDMSQLKLGVRSVAGKLSVMASGVVNTIQVRPRTLHHPKRFVSIQQISNDLFLLKSRITTTPESLGFNTSTEAKEGVSTCTAQQIYTTKNMLYVYYCVFVMWGGGETSRVL